MSDVFVTTYQIVGEGQAIAAAHWAEYDRVRKTHISFMQAQGALAYREGFSGRVRSLFFDGEQKPPCDYRGTGEKHHLNEKWLEEKVPRGNSKAGKALQKLFDATARLPDAMDLASKLEWATPRIYPGSGNKIHFPTLCRVSLPSEVTFLRLPRKADDGWVQPKDVLTAIPEDELMFYLHQHNLLAKDTEE